jgi:hypothetical protein
VARDTLFDLAVKRSLAYIQSLKLPNHDKEILQQHLQVWYLKTRFAYRIPLNEIIDVLQRYPGQGVWSGGKDGKWQDKHTA